MKDRLVVIVIAVPDIVVMITSLLDPGGGGLGEAPGLVLPLGDLVEEVSIGLDESITVIEAADDELLVNPAKLEVDDDAV